MEGSRTTFKNVILVSVFIVDWLIATGFLNWIFLHSNGITFSINLFQLLVNTFFSSHQWSQENNLKSWKWFLSIYRNQTIITTGRKYSRTDQVKFFEAFLPQILLCPFLNALTQVCCQLQKVFSVLLITL